MKTPLPEFATDPLIIGGTRGVKRFPSTPKRSSSVPAAIVWDLYSDYQAGMPLNAIGRKHNRHGSDIRELFRHRGLKLRKPDRSKHLPNGCFRPHRPHTRAEILREIAALKTFKIPPALRNDWRDWSWPKRAWLIKLLWKKFPANRMLQTPHSANVTPFDYASASAQRIAEKQNSGLPSRLWHTRRFPNSNGMIWNGRLFFWVSGKDGSYQTGKYIPGKGRECLHWTVWSHHNGRPVPPKTTVIFLDGNKNNFNPENLALRTMADCARINQSNHFRAAALQRAAAALENFNGE